MSPSKTVATVAAVATGCSHRFVDSTNKRFRAFCWRVAFVVLMAKVLVSGCDRPRRPMLASGAVNPVLDQGIRVARHIRPCGDQTRNTSNPASPPAVAFWAILKTNFSIPLL